MTNASCTPGQGFFSASSKSSAPALCSGFALDLRADAPVGFMAGPRGCGKTTILRTISGVLDADRGEVGHSCRRFEAGPQAGDQFLGIVLDPAGLRVQLRKFPLSYRHDVTTVVEYDRAAAGCTLVECEDVRHITLCGYVR